MWDNDQLKPQAEVGARACDACFNEWSMWDTIIDAVGDPVWGDLAFRGFKIEQMVTEFHVPIERLSDVDYQLMVTVHQERQRREGQLAFQRQEAQQQASKARAGS